MFNMVEFSWADSFTALLFFKKKTFVNIYCSEIFQKKPSAKVYSGKFTESMPVVKFAPS